MGSAAANGGQIHTHLGGELPGAGAGRRCDRRSPQEPPGLVPVGQGRVPDWLPEAATTGAGAAGAAGAGGASTAAEAGAEDVGAEDVGALALASAISASVSTIRPMVSPTGAVLPAGMRTAARKPS